MALVLSSESRTAAAIAFFFLVQTQDAFFDRIFRHQAIHRHWALLSDAVGAIRCLRLDSGIPPRVEVDDIVGCCQVETESAGFQTDQE